MLDFKSEVGFQVHNSKLHVGFRIVAGSEYVAGFRVRYSKPDLNGGFDIRILKPGQETATQVLESESSFQNRSQNGFARRTQSRSKTMLKQDGAEAR